MDFSKATVVKNQYTYSEISKPMKRHQMALAGVSDLGTQSGGFGEFTPHFKVLSADAVSELKKEILSACEGDESKLSLLISNCPTLWSVLK